jgi:flagellar biosynthesis chaperone FliJ
MEETKSNLQQKIQDLEQHFKELETSLNESKKKVVSNESALLACLQQLMPLQNMYLTNIVQNLQKQVQDKTLEIEVLNKKLCEKNKSKDE